MRASRLLLAAVAIVSSTVRADPPKFEFKKPEDIKKKVEWKLSAQLGLVMQGQGRRVVGGREPLAARSRQEDHGC